MTNLLSDVICTGVIGICAIILIICWFKDDVIEIIEAIGKVRKGK